MRSFENKVLATVRAHGMLPREGTVLLAVSGGADSLAMLHAMAALVRRRFPGLKLHVGHLNHGIRGAAASADARFVREECRRLGVLCTVGRANVPALAQARGVGTEEAGRDARYAFLVRLARRIGARTVATAHHAGDQAETVLMRIRRGAGPRGLAGIPHVRELPTPDAAPLRLVRPLLDVSREEIDAYVLARALAPRIDATNRSSLYLRNRVRLRVLPGMETRWPGVRTGLLRVADAARSLRTASERLRRKAAQGLTRVEDGCLLIDAARARRLPQSLVADAVDDALREAGLLRRMLTQRDFAALAKLLRRRSAVSLSGGLIAKREGNEIAVWRDERGPAGEVEIEVVGRTGFGTRDSGLGNGGRAGASSTSSASSFSSSSSSSSSSVAVPPPPAQESCASGKRRHAPSRVAQASACGRSRRSQMGSQTDDQSPPPAEGRPTDAGNPSTHREHERQQQPTTRNRERASRSHTPHPAPRTPSVLTPLVTAEVMPGSMDLLSQRPPDGSIEFLDFDRVTLPLRLRPVRPGDRMRPLGMEGRRKISDILTDLRVPARRKRSAMVVTMRDEPIWLVGRRISDDVKLTPATRRVLRLAVAAASKL